MFAPMGSLFVGRLTAQAPLTSEGALALLSVRDLSTDEQILLCLATKDLR